MPITEIIFLKSISLNAFYPNDKPPLAKREKKKS